MIVQVMYPFCIAGFGNIEPWIWIGLLNCHKAFILLVAMTNYESNALDGFFINFTLFGFQFFFQKGNSIQKLGSILWPNQKGRNSSNLRA